MLLLAQHATRLASRNITIDTAQPIKTGRKNSFWNRAFNSHSKWDYLNS